MSTQEDDNSAALYANGGDLLFQLNKDGTSEFTMRFAMDNGSDITVEAKELSKLLEFLKQATAMVQTHLDKQTGK